MKWIAVWLNTRVYQADLDEAFKVLDMHDEAQWEMDKENYPEFTALVHEAFDECTLHFNLKCRLEADVKQGINWHETH